MDQDSFDEVASSKVRKLMVSTRIAALGGNVVGACNTLKLQIMSARERSNIDTMAMGLLWAELLHLNFDDEQAQAVFAANVEPLMRMVPAPIRFAAEDNLAKLQMSQFMERGISAFYHLVDQQRVANFEFVRSAMLLEAQEFLDKQRYEEAAALLWQCLLRAYRLGSWRTVQWVSDKLADASLKANDLDRCCFYAVLSQSEKRSEELGRAISSQNDATLIRSLLHRLMRMANLGRHFVVACKFIAQISDLIPDGDVVALVEWLLSRCRMPARLGGGEMRSAWTAVRALGGRVPAPIASKLLDAAVNHPEWQAAVPEGNRVLIDRKPLLEAAARFAHSVPVESYSHFVDAVLPLATVRRQMTDYPDAIELLCHLSDLGGGQIRNRVCQALYEPGRPVDRILVHLSDFFGVQALSEVQLEEFAKRVAEETRLTVQRLGPDDSAKPVSETIMISTRNVSDGRIQVIVGGSVGIQALVHNVNKLSDGSIENVVRAIVDMATDSDNMFSNRESLLSQLEGFEKRMPASLKDEIINRILPMAHGQFFNDGEQKAEAIAWGGMGTLEQVQGMALVAAASLCGTDAARLASIRPALDAAFVSPHAALRKAAYSAARKLPSLSGEHLLPVLMGLRDSDISAAVAAFAAFVDRPEWRLSRSMTGLFILAARLASQSPEVRLRRHAAFAVRVRLDSSSNRGGKRELRAIIATLSSDVSYSVRAAALDTAKSP